MMGSESGRWYKFHRVKGLYIEDCYQLQKEIETLIQKGHLKKYVKGDSSHSNGKSKSRVRDGARIPKLNKSKEAPHGESSKVVC